VFINFFFIFVNAPPPRFRDPNNIAYALHICSMCKLISQFNLNIKNKIVFH